MNKHTPLFLKLGGSLLTDKTGVEAVRADVLARAAQEIRRALDDRPGLRLLLGHGSGSFGHVAGARYGTRQGVHTPEQWWGFAEVGAAAARLNGLVMEALRAAGVPALRLPPSASVVCADGRIASLTLPPVQMALDAGLVPVVFGDVAFDARRGGTIVSTEEALVALADELRPSWLLLAGETEGVYDLDGAVIPEITPANFAAVAPALGGSRGADVTGGMAAKVRSMLDLAAAHPHLAMRIFSGLQPDNLRRALLAPEAAPGTVIRFNHG